MARVAPEENDNPPFLPIVFSGIVGHNMQNRKEYLRQYRLKNKERLKKLHKEYYEANKEKLKEDFKQYYLKTRDKRRELGKLHYEQNKTLYLAYSRTRKATIKRACPNCLTEDDLKIITSIYSECKRISEITGIPHHVDHIVPLQGKNICGLHVPCNLQILTKEENLRKGNKYE